MMPLKNHFGSLQPFSGWFILKIFFVKEMGECEAFLYSYALKSRTVDPLLLTVHTYYISSLSEQCVHTLFYSRKTKHS